MIIKDYIKGFADCSKCKHIDAKYLPEDERIVLTCKKNLPISLTIGACAEYEKSKHVIECHK